MWYSPVRLRKAPDRRLLPVDESVTAPDLSFDRVEPVVSGFIDDYLRLHDLDPQRFRARPLPGRELVRLHSLAMQLPSPRGPGVRHSPAA